MAGNHNVLRVGIVGPLPPPSGGMANQTRQLARLLQEEGHTVQIIQVNAPYRPAWVANVRWLRSLFRLVPYVRKLWVTAGKVQLFHVMANSWWSWHLFSAPAVWVARWRGIPVVVNYRGGEAEDFLKRSYRCIRPTLKRVNAVIVPTAFLCQVFMKWRINATVVPNIVDLQLFSRKAVPASGGSGNGSAPHIIVARNLEKIYDLPTALRAFQRIRGRYPRARMTVAGSGPEREALQRLAAELNVTAAVTFAGRIDNNDMAAVYHSADVMINPSLADNMPISVLEALATGVPVVSTNVGGIPYLVADGVSARLVPPGDISAMADAVIDILSNKALAGRLIASGQDLVKQYAWPAVRNKLLCVYDEVLGATQGQAALNPHE